METENLLTQSRCDVIDSGHKLSDKMTRSNAVGARTYRLRSRATLQSTSAPPCRNLSTDSFYGRKEEIDNYRRTDRANRYRVHVLRRKNLFSPEDTKPIVPTITHSDSATEPYLDKSDKIFEGKDKFAHRSSFNPSFQAAESTERIADCCEQKFTCKQVGI